MDKLARICVVGDKGTLGHAICGQLKMEGYENVISCPALSPSKAAYSPKKLQGTTVKKSSPYSLL